MTYSVSDIAVACGISRTTVAWRLRALGLKAPHNEDHLKAVQNYLVRDKPLTLWQMVKQKYGDTDSDTVTAHYQSYIYRLTKLGKPDIASLDELEGLWNQHVEERKTHTKEYQKYNHHIGTSAPLVKKHSPKLRHLFDWSSFDPSGIYDNEVKQFYLFYCDCGFKSCQARRLAYLEVLHMHHVIDTDEYFEARESKQKLKMLLY